jgi:hypothetical protein
MVAMPSALGFLLMIFAGWVNRHQLIAIGYLKTENRMLRERLKGRRLRFTVAERALLAEGTLSSLITALSTLVSQPHPRHQQQVSVLRQTLREALTAASSNNFGPL